jgi:Ca2+-binding RTX toxin-like protein
MKKLIFIVVFITTFCSCAKAQNINNLSVNEFYDQIEFDGVTLQKLIDTQKNSKSIQSLFTNTIILTQEDPLIPEYFKYTVNEYVFGFEWVGNYALGEGTSNITYALVTGKSEISIKGIKIKLGDNISKLGNVVVNTNNIIFHQIETNAGLNLEFIVFSNGDKLVSKIQVDFF